MKKKIRSMLRKFKNRLSPFFSVSKIRLKSARNREIRKLVAQRDATHFTEYRARLAAMEAKAYADQGLFALSNSMRAAHTIVAQTRKRVDALESLLSHKLNVDPWQGEVNTALRNLEHDVSGTIQNYDRQLRSIEQRIEFVRAETMYELQASLLKSKSNTHSPASSTIETKILNPEKVAEMKKTSLRLNVGCGHIQPNGFLNVDGRALPGIDIIAEATAIPLNEGEVDEVFSSHLVEHFTRHVLERVLLPHWASLLRQGGTLTTVAPDGAAMLKAVNTGGMTFEDFREVLFGGQDYDGDFHYNLITPDDFSALLGRLGFTNVTQDYVGKRNGKCFEFKITARKQ